jgi:hypothetical protein
MKVQLGVGPTDVSVLSLDGKQKTPRTYFSYDCNAQADETTHRQPPIVKRYRTVVGVTVC